MPQPYDYTLKTQDPAAAMMEGLQIRAGRLQLQKAEMEAAQAKAGIAQQQQLNSDLAAVSQNHNPAAVAQLMVKYPQLSEQFKRSYEALGTEQQKSKVNLASQAYASLLAGDNDTAASTLKGYADAYRNSGMNQDAAAADHMADLIRTHPEMAKMTGGIYLASAMGPEKFQETFGKLESERRERDLEPSKLTTAQADARKAATAANFADSDAAMDLQKKGWDIYKIQEDVKIARENSRIAAMNATLSKETNELKRQELADKLKDAQLERDQKVRDKLATVEASRTTLDNGINTIDRLLKNPALNDVLGSFEGSTVGGAISSAAKAVNPLKWNSDDRANAQADIDTIKSQTLLTQLMSMKNSSSTGASGMGALNEKEGEALMNGIQSLNTKQSEEQFRANAAEIRRLLMKSRGNLVTKHGLPDTLPDTPNVQTTPDEIDALLKKYGGQ